MMDLSPFDPLTEESSFIVNSLDAVFYKKEGVTG